MTKNFQGGSKSPKKNFFSSSPFTCRASLHILNDQIAFVDGETIVSADINYLILKIIDGKISSVWSNLPTTNVWEASDWEVVELISRLIIKQKHWDTIEYNKGYLSLQTHIVLPHDFSNFWVRIDLTVKVNIVSLFYFIFRKILSQSQPNLRRIWNIFKS